MDYSQVAKLYGLSSYVSVVICGLSSVSIQVINGVKRHLTGQNFFSCYFQFLLIWLYLLELFQIMLKIFRIIGAGLP